MDGFIPKIDGSQNVTAIRPVTWNKIADKVNGDRLSQINTLSPAGLGWPPVFVANKTGSAITSPYRAFSLGEPVWTIAANKLPDCCFRLEAYDAAKPIAVVQQPLAVDEPGLAVVVGPSLLEVTGAGSTSDRKGSPNSSGIVVPGSGDKVVFANQRPSGGGKVLAILGAATSSKGRIFKTPVGGIPSAIGSTWGSATCTEWDENGVSLASSSAIHNHRTSIVPGEVFILVLAVGDKLFVWEGNCPEVIAPP